MGTCLIHAGDFMAFGDTPREIVDFNQWLGKQPHRHKIVIAGNHDLMFERHPGAAQRAASAMQSISKTQHGSGGFEDLGIASSARIQQLGF